MGILKINEEELARYIKDISSGDEASLRSFYDNYGRLILAFILSIVNSIESAEGALQDVLMAIVTHQTDNYIKNPKAWLFKVILNISKRKAKQDYSVQAEQLPEDENIVSEDNFSESIENTVDQIESLKCLDEIEQQCVIMCVFGQMKLPQVAEILGMPYKKVCNKYDYAVRKLRKYYEKRRKSA